jgi:hypothetical protein
MMHRAGTEIGLMMERCPIRDFDVTDMRRRLPEAILMLANIEVSETRFISPSINAKT